MKIRYAAGIAAVSLALVASGCSASGGAKEKETVDGAGKTVTILTHDSFVLPEETIAAFEEETGYKLKTLAPGDAGTVLSQLILTKDNPSADGVFGIESFSAQTAIDEGVFADYTPENDPGKDYRVGGLTAIDMGDVCINVDSKWFEENGQEAPASFEDLTKPEYKGLTVLTNPATSSPGLAFLVATATTMDDWQGYWKDLLGNEARIADSWSTAYYTDFTGGAEAGTHPVVLSYASSPAESEGATASVDSTCIRQVEYAGVVEGAENPEGAQAFIDFLLSDEVQAQFPENMYMYPVADVDLPETWSTYAKLADDPILPDPAEVNENREAWIKDWTALWEAQN